MTGSWKVTGGEADTLVVTEAKLTSTLLTYRPILFKSYAGITGVKVHVKSGIDSGN